jgi:tetratricopeptide (TPR) repeat protein
MSDSFRTDGSRAIDAASDADRDAKIEQLLLTGLDHYFAARYEQAINVWTRALFFDRSHPRARAYIERARSALAERQRRSEELIQNGVAAFDRGESEEAKRLLQAALDGGAAADDARALLDRLSHDMHPDVVDAAADSALTAPPRAPRRRARAAAAASDNRKSRAGLGLLFAAAVIVAAIGGYRFSVRNGIDLRSIVRLPGRAEGSAVAQPVAHEVALPLPRRGELALGRARSLAASGRLREALSVLDTVWPADPQKPDADRVRTDIQRQLLGLAANPRPSAPARDKGTEDGRR